MYNICIRQVYIFGRHQEALMISYRKLWEKIDKKGWSQYSLINDFGINAATIQKLKRNEYVRTATIDRFCELLDCQPSDLIDLVEETDDEISKALHYAETKEY